MEKRSDNNKLPAIVGIVLAVIFLLAAGAGMIFLNLSNSINGNFSLRNMGWVWKMNKTFPDDEFTYVGYDKFAVAGLGAFSNRNVIVVASKNILTGRSP